MAVIYLRSTDGDDASDGSTWALAKLTMAAAVTAAGDGGTVYVSQAHAGTVAASITITCPTSQSNAVTVLCVNDGAEPPTALATTATVAVTGGNTITINGFGYFYGITFLAGSGTSNGLIYVQSSSGVSNGLIFESCSFRLAGNSSLSRIRFGGTASATTQDRYLKLINCTFQFANAAQNLQLGGLVYLENLAWTGGGTAPTSALFRINANNDAQAYIYGCNFANLVDVPLVDATTLTTGGIWFRNCKLDDGATVIPPGTIPGPGSALVYYDNCDSGDTNYKMAHYKFQGSIVVDAATYKTGGATDGTTRISHTMDANAGALFTSPLRGVPITAWNETVGSGITVTVDILHDSETNLQDDEVWLEVEYLGTSGFPLALLISDRMTNILSTPADQTASASEWTEALANDNEQKLAVTFTPQEKGLIRATVCLAKDYTIYVDPLLVIT